MIHRRSLHRKSVPNDASLEFVSAEHFYSMPRLVTGIKDTGFQLFQE